MTASGAYRDIRVCAGIVGNADCILARLLEVLLIEALRSTAGTALVLTPT